AELRLHRPMAAVQLRRREWWGPDGQRGSTMTGPRDALEEIYEPEQLVLSDLINRVLDKGVVISSNIIISIADIDLIDLDLRLVISAVATLHQRAVERAQRANVPVRSPSHP